ncbi:transposase, partial [[Clostridium] clostridioforme]|nr:transposase [Enterocloster clostridioformis]
MTGVQALEHKYPDKLPLPGQCAKMEFEYIRHGTTSLIGFFD